jgi:hypothetical protein
MLGCGQLSPESSEPVEGAPAVDDSMFDDLSAVPVPPEDGPRRAPLELSVPVLSKPERGAAPVGYLRLGSTVARSVDPVSNVECPGGWYAVRPLGFNGDDIAFCKNLTTEDGVAAVPFSAFYKDGIASGVDHFARFCYCKQDSVLDMAVERLAKHFRK